MRATLQTIRENLHPLFYIRRFSFARRILKMIDVPVWLWIPGISFPVRGRLVTHGLAYAAAGSQEPGPEALVKATVKTLNVRSFWDIGANIGLYTWLLKTESPSIEIVQYEPLPTNTALVRETISHNGLDRVALVQAGVSDRIGRSILRTDEVSGTTSTLEDGDDTFASRHWGDAGSHLEVSTVTIDGERHQRGPVDLLKVDVEGHEESVLRGAARTIHTDRPVLFIECGHRGHCLNSLIAKGYRVVNADKLVIDEWRDATNFFAVPPRHAEAVSDILTTAKRLCRTKL